MFESLTNGFQSLLDRLQKSGKLTEDNVKEALREVRMALLEADVNLGVARDFIAKVRDKAVGEEVIKGVDPGQMIVKIIHDELVALMGPENAPLVRAESGPTVILMAGLQGAGKTTTCGKLANRLKSEGRKVLLCAADLQRPAAVEQLQVLGRDLGVEVHADTSGKSPPAVCADALERARRDHFDILILDTAGRLHVDDALMNEVAEVAKRTSPHEVLLVLDSLTGQDAVQSAKVFDERLPLTGVILTKLDGDNRGGAALSVKQVTGKPIKFIGLGEKLDKLDVFHPSRMADRILGMGDVVSLVERAQSVMDEEEAERQAEKLFMGSFTLDDFLGLLEKIQSMGSIKDLLGMVPGLGQKMQGMEIDEKEFSRQRAMITSMTLQERLHPEILNVSRRERIARGAGRTVEHVNMLLRNFKNMKKQMQAMKKMGFLGGLMDPTKALQKDKRRQLEEMNRLGVNPMDLSQLKAYKQHVQRTEKAKARKDKSKKKRR